MKRKCYSRAELTGIAYDFVKSLKPKGMTIREIQEVFQIAISATNNIIYGEPLVVSEADEAEAL